MEILTVIKKVLEDNSGVSTLATGGIHLFKVPQNGQRPNIVLDLISGTDSWTQQGPMKFYDVRVRVICRGSDDNKVRELGKASFALLQNGTGTEYGIEITNIFHTMMTGDYQDAAEIYRQIDDYRVHYKQ